MSALRVEIDGKVVWSGQTDGDGGLYDYPPEYAKRPDDPAEGEPFPSAHHLILDDEIIGVQISLAEENELIAADKAAKAASAGGEG